MHSAISIRPFVREDAAPLTELLHESFAELGDTGLNYTAVYQDAETTLARALAGSCFIAEIDTQMVGSITISLPPPDAIRALTSAAREPHRACLNQFAVLPAMRKRGIATALWQMTLDWANDNGATSLGIDSAKTAAHLVRLYRFLGFTIVDTIQLADKTYESVVMTRPLRPRDRPEHVTHY